jgi:hypothetical protein
MLVGGPIDQRDLIDLQVVETLSNSWHGVPQCVR